MLRSVTCTHLTFYKRHTYPTISYESFPACIAKGLRKELCIEGCRECRLAYLICDGRKPCSRCLENNLECLDNVNAASESSIPIAAIGNATSSRHPQTLERTKVACLSCRRLRVIPSPFADKSGTYSYLEIINDVKILDRVHDAYTERRNA